MGTEQETELCVQLDHIEKKTRRKFMGNVKNSYLGVMK